MSIYEEHLNMSRQNAGGKCMKFKFVILKNDDVIYTGDQLIEGAILQGLFTH